MNGASVPRLMIFVLLATIPAAILRLTQDGPALCLQLLAGPLGALAGEALLRPQPLKPQGRKRVTYRMASGPRLTGQRWPRPRGPSWRPRHRPGQSALRRSGAQPF